MKRSLALILLIVASSGLSFAATKFRLHNSPSSIAGYSAMDLALGPVGATVQTSVTNTTGSGTSIQATKTGGGTVLKWISEPISAGFTLSGTVTCNVYAKEQSAANNATVQCQLYKYSGSEGASIFSANFGSELTTSIAANNWTGSPSSTAFSTGDRIVLKLFVVNVGTMGAGTPGVTADYDGPTDAADGSTWVQINESVTTTADGGTGGTPNLVQYSSDANYQFTALATNDTKIVYLPNNSGSANMILVCFGADPASAPTPTDNQSNTYNLVGTLLDTTNNEQIWCYNALNAAANTRKITITAHGASNWIVDAVAEYTNVATSSALELSTAAFNSTSTVAAGSVTPLYSGDLVVQFAWNAYACCITPGITWTAGSQSNISWQLWLADNEYDAGAQWGVYNSTSALNPTFTDAGSIVGFATLAMFFRSSTAGTAQPSGSQVTARKQGFYTSNAPTNANPHTQQLPCPTNTNLVVVNYSSGGNDLTGITSSPSFTWAPAHAFYGTGTPRLHNWYAANASATPATTVTLTFANAANSESAEMYCVKGVATAPFDHADNAIGTQSVAGNLTTVTATPGQANGIVFMSGSQLQNTSIGFTNANLLWDGCITSGEAVSNDGCAENNQWGHYLNPDTSAVTFVSPQTGGATAVLDWVAEADSFNPPTASSCRTSLLLMGVGCH